MSQTPDPKLLPPSHARTRDETGSIQPFVIVGLGSLLLLLGFTLNLGQLFSATTQLQASADAASRAAANEIANQLLQNPEISLDTLRERATGMARTVLAERRVVNSSGTNISVEFGQFDFNGGQFFRLSNLIQPTAVRVTVRPQGASGSNAVRLLMPTSDAANVELSRSSVSALRTTNRVFLVDVSSSFGDSIDDVQAVLRSNINSLIDRGDVERVGIIPFRNRVVESRVVGLVPPNDARVKSTIDSLNANGVLCRFGGENVPFPDCSGTDLAGALDRALLMVAFQGTSPSNTVVTLLTDGEPCEIPTELVRSRILEPVQAVPTTLVERPNDPATGGGSSADAARAAAQRLCRRASLNTIAIDTRGSDGDPGLCPSLTQTSEFLPRKFCRRTLLGRVCIEVAVQPVGGVRQPVFFKETSSDDALMSEMVCNFGRKFPSDTTRAGLAQELRRAASTLPPVTVQ